MDPAVVPELMAVATFISNKIHPFNSQLDLAACSGEAQKVCINLLQAAE